LDSDVATTETALARDRADCERSRKKCEDLQNKPEPQWTAQERKDNNDYAVSQLLVMEDEQRLRDQTKERDDLRNKVSADRARTQSDVARTVVQPLNVRPQSVEPCR
jgi:CHASE3 domain sensor protein